ncbi:HEXXH motif domain-containing protein [Actinoallomurus purpureus]|uniref:HEXXH motif domain-containing protein n=1 Tax=Actinoallomurus purpureus TaxID=478114 RepID=UPI0020924B63|nr:HEXXH motif domain-containing protein [Actinoallomurus purpureus]MCO6003632.1 HEXXH motif domain-containing protein [Actinoallomurus purpureus]
MTDPHDMPEVSFRNLAGGNADLTAVRRLARAERSKHVALIRTLVGLSETTGHPQARAVCAAYEALGAIQHAAPEAVSDVLAYPAVGAWALRTVLGLRRRPADVVHPERLATIAAAAAIRGRVPARIEIPGTGVELPSLGAASLPGPASVRVHPDGAEIVHGRDAVEVPADPHRAAPGWRGLSVISGRGVRFVLDDMDGYHFSSRTTRHRRLTEAAVEEWRARIGRGWRSLDRDHPGVVAEVRETIVALVPLDSPAGSLASATSREAFGCVAMSLPPDDRLIPVTFAHEVQHAKLNALMDLFPLVDGPGRDRFYAPWRDDPRPLVGLLHGAYAHLGVAGYWRRQRSRETDPVLAFHAHTEFARWRQAAYEAAEALLRSGRLTEAGRLFVSEMRATLDRWREEKVPRPALARARRQAARHRERWLRANGS